MMIEAFICDAVRTPIGRYGGALSSVRPDDLAAVVLRELTKRNAELDPKAVDDVILGCANQAGEDNRNVARMSALLAGLPADVPGATINRRGRYRDRRRRREHEPGALRDVEGRGALRTRRADVRYHHRLAVRESVDQ